MSHPYGPDHASFSQSGRPGNSHFGHRRGGRGCSAFSEEQLGRGHHGSRGRGGHPAGLRGKEIGLYYRDKARARNKDRGPTHAITLDVRTEQKIQSLLESTKSPYVRRTEGASDASERKEGELEAKYTHINDSHFKRKFLEIVSGDIQRNLSKALLLKSKLERNEMLDKEMLEEQKARETLEEYKTMLKFREKLPTFRSKEEILNLVEENQIIVISGETGCGKTTQVAQFILDHEIARGNGSVTKVICTQPRRISAISVADRVSVERAEKLGKSVGFQIRLEKVSARNSGSILFCTTGVLLQFLQSDPALRDYSHIILDEIHERNTESDFVITLLKEIIPKRPDLKIILMSATLNSQQFSRYYQNCPNIHIPGFTYPVEELYLEDVLQITRFRFPEDSLPPANSKKHFKRQRSEQHKRDEFLNLIQPYTRHLESQKKYPQFVIDQLRNPMSEELSLELIEELTRHICATKDPGAILIFLPGIMDISKLNRMMLESGNYPSSNYVIYPLHSRMPTVEQRLIFEKPPRSVRKIIIATSIAETSITIEDVVYVIDCGKTKLSRFDVENNIQTLEPEWVSIANAKQRRGRAGRVQPGICYHLYTKIRESLMEEYPLPEMLRTRLEEVILQAKILQLGRIEPFLARVMDPPDAKAIELSLELLGTLNALDSSEHLTPLGYHLAQLPLDPRTGKMIIWGALFSCVEPVFAIAASLTFKDAFYCPLGKEDQAKRMKMELGLDQFSDHVALAEALRRFEKAYKRGNSGSFCREYFLSWNTLKLLSDMKGQFARHLCEMKFLHSDDPSDYRANRNSDNLALVKAVICAGLYPNIAIVRSAKKHGVQAITPEDGKVKIHPSSINEKATSFPSPYLAYYTKKRSTAIYLHDTTSISPMALLFAGPSSSIGEHNGKSVIVLTSALTFLCKPSTAQIVQKLREKLDNLLEHKITHPGTVRWEGHEGTVLKAIIELVSQGDAEMGLKRQEYHLRFSGDLYPDSE